VLVTGSAGHLGEALVRTLRDSRHEVVGLDVLDSPYTTVVGSITDRPLVRRCMTGVRAVFHAATLHKPHVATHPRQAFVDVNVRGVKLAGKWHGFFVGKWRGARAYDRHRTHNPIRHNISAVIRRCSRNPTRVPGVPPSLASLCRLRQPDRPTQSPAKSLI